MAGLSTSLTIALWMVGACWAVAIVAYLCGVAAELVVPVTILGLFTGLAEIVIRRTQR